MLQSCFLLCSAHSLECLKQLHLQYVGLFRLDKLFKMNFFLSSQPIFTMSAQQKQLQNMTAEEFAKFTKKYFGDDVSTAK